MKETKTVQCYPSDSAVNRMVAEYGAFGWELLNNQRCQEFEKQTFSSDGSSTKHYSTFNKLTFQREKTSTWYNEVTNLESEYFRLMNLEPSSQRKTTGGQMCFLGFLMSVIGIIVAIAVAVAAAAVAVIGVILLICGIVKIKNYNAEKREWESVSEPKARSIRAKSEKIVNS